MNSLLCVLVVDGEQLLQPMEEELLMLEGGLGQRLLLSVLLSPCQLGHSPVLVVDSEQLLQPMSFQFWRGSDTFLRFFRFDANNNLLRIDMWGLSRSCSGPMNKQLTKNI